MTNSSVTDKAKKIKLLLLDVDGVLSDGKIYFDNNGIELKSFNTLDGHGIKILMRSGVQVGIITGRTSQIVKKRADDLGIDLLIQGREDKYTAMQELIKEYPCELEEIAFMGDDYPDLTVMTKVGLALTVANALPVMRQHAHWQSSRAGGEGAVREACDLIMQAQNTFDAALQKFL